MPHEATATSVYSFFLFLSLFPSISPSPSLPFSRSDTFSIYNVEGRIYHIIELWEFQGQTHGDVIMYNPFDEL